MKWLLLLLFPISSLAQCILDDNVTVDIAPIGGTYQPGQTITFTYTITAYQGLLVNWMHGIAIALGGGWNGRYYGRLSPNGIYTYKMIYHDYKNNIKPVVGKVSLIR